MNRNRIQQRTKWSSSIKFLCILWHQTAAQVGLLASLPAQAQSGGAVFVTAHDPDFHGQSSQGARHLLQVAMDYVSQGQILEKFLYISSFPGCTPDDNSCAPEHFLNPMVTLRMMGLEPGIHYDHVDAAQFLVTDLRSYRFLFVPSDHGGLLMQSDLDALVARTEDILDYVNHGGGLLACAESGGLAPDTSKHFKFVPFLSSTNRFTQAETGSGLTAFGASLGLLPRDIDSNFSHSLFETAGGMHVVDVDRRGRILSLAYTGFFFPDRVGDQSVNVSPRSSVVETGTEGCWRMTVLGDAAPPSGLEVTWTVSGANPGNHASLTDATGIATLCYIGSSNGLDTVIGNVGGRHASASVAWTSLRSCSSDPAASGRMATRLEYVGADSAPCDSPLAAAVTLESEDGTRLAGKTVTFEFNGQILTAVSDTAGVARIALPTTGLVGTRSLTARFVGSAEHEPSNTNRFLQLCTGAPPQTPTQLTYQGTTTLACGEDLSAAARLQTANGAAVVGQMLLFTVGSETRAAVTDVHGVASATVPVPASGGVTVVVTFSGTTMLLGSSTAQGITGCILPNVTTLLTYNGSTAAACGSSIHAAAQLRTEAAELLAGHLVRFTFGGLTVVVSTDSNGVAATDAFFPTVGADALLTMDFAGADPFEPSTAVVTIAPCSRRSPSLAYTGQFAVTCGEPLHASASLLEPSGAPIAGAAVTFSVAGFTALATTDPTGSASATFTITEVNGSAGLVLSFNGDEQRLPATANATIALCSPVATSLAYLGPDFLQCGAPFTAAVRLADANGDVIPNAAVTLTADGVSVVALSDLTGIARGAFAGALTAGVLGASYAGNAGHLAAALVTTVPVAAASSVLTYTGPLSVAGGGIQSVSVRLTSAVDGVPIPNAEVTFSVNNSDTTVATDADGVATATLLFGADSVTVVDISYPGSGCHGAAQTSVAVQHALGTSFVLWGGNPEPLRVGDRVNFWGSQWVRQVVGGDYPANASFKGHAKLAQQDLALCLEHRRTNSNPALNDTCWQSKPGNSHPPAVLPAYITVAVATSINKNGNTIFGNIAGAVVLEVEPGYGPNPGHQGYGTIVSVLTGNSVVQSPASLSRFSLSAEAAGAVFLSAHQTQPVHLLPSESGVVRTVVSNASDAEASDLLVDYAFDGPPARATQIFHGSLAPRTATELVVMVQAPSLNSIRSPSETSADFLSRLASATGLPVVTTTTLSWSDPEANTYPPISLTSQSVTALPRIEAVFSGPDCSAATEESSYSIALRNAGNAEAHQVQLRSLLPDVPPTSSGIALIAAGDSQSIPVAWTLPPVDGPGATETSEAYLDRLRLENGRQLTSRAEVSWQDAMGNTYGSVVAEHPVRRGLPVLSAALHVQSVMAPGEQVDVSAVILNEGFDHARQVSVLLIFPDGTTSTQEIPELQAGAAYVVSAPWLVPGLAPRSALETEAAYVARLQALIAPHEFHAWVNWSNAVGHTFGPSHADTQSTERIALLSQSLVGPTSSEAGAVARYSDTLVNIGTAPAREVELTLTVPNGTVREHAFAAITAGQSLLDLIDARIPDRLTSPFLKVPVSVVWKDVLGNAYGPLTAQVTTFINNQGPRVDAGIDRSVLRSSSPVRLFATVSDDGLPFGGLSSYWQILEAPGTPTLSGSFNNLSPFLHFNAVGRHRLLLCASDTAQQRCDDVIVDVSEAANAAPTVGAGGAQLVTLPNRVVALAGLATDDGLPVWGTLQTVWTQVSGPSPGSIATPADLNTNVTLGAAGVYVFRLTASDGVLSASAQVTVSLGGAAGNLPPVVNAGPDQALGWPVRAAVLSGAATDDGLPAGAPLTAFWTLVSGPRQASVENPYSLAASVMFSSAGTYVLRLTATDSQLTASDDLTIQVLPGAAPWDPPDVSAVDLNDLQQITRPVTVSAQVVSPGLELWSLERRLVGDGDWTSFATGTQLPVTALLDPTLMLNGLYEVRATATDTGGQVSDGPEVTIEVSGQMKVGELELTFLDAQIPLLGIPIELYRHYDSRDRGDHEFGRSWNMQVGSVRLQKSQPAGEQWFWDRSTGLFPTYCFEPVRPKVVTVRLPGNQLHEFEARFEPRCSFLVPPDAGKIVYAARPGTNSTLRPLGTDEVIRDGSELFGSPDIRVGENDDGSWVGEGRLDGGGRRET